MVAVVRGSVSWIDERLLLLCAPASGKAGVSLGPVFWPEGRMRLI